MVETIAPIRPRRKTTRNKKRRFTRIYHLENDKGQKGNVCQKMLLCKTCLTADKIIVTVLSKSGDSRTNNVSDKRGKAEPANKKQKQKR